MDGYRTGARGRRVGPGSPVTASGRPKERDVDRGVHARATVGHEPGRVRADLDVKDTVEPIRDRRDGHDVIDRRRHASLELERSPEALVRQGVLLDGSAEPLSK